MDEFIRRVHHFLTFGQKPAQPERLAMSAVAFENAIAQILRFSQTPGLMMLLRDPYELICIKFCHGRYCTVE